LRRITGTGIVFSYGVSFCSPSHPPLFASPALEMPEPEHFEKHPSEKENIGKAPGVRQKRHNFQIPVNIDYGKGYPCKNCPL
jgi:hypothetical protein